MQAMLDDVAPKLATGAPVIAETIPAGSLFEGAYADALGDLAAANPELSIGSYPTFRDGGFHNEIVVRGKDAAMVAAAAATVGAMVARLAKEWPEPRCREHAAKRTPLP
jgi:molybdopterin-biosynthesis enzyme MoeA-like protein